MLRPPQLQGPDGASAVSAWMGMGLAVAGAAGGAVVGTRYDRPAVGAGVGVLAAIVVSSTIAAALQTAGV